jgi:hypothetical protein
MTGQIIPIAQKWNNATAAKIVKADFESAERFRMANHDRRFVESDRLYLGWINKKTWEGTKIPRSAVPVMMLFSQLEALLPHVVSAIFSQDIPFDCEPMPGTTLAQARAVRTLLANQLDDIDGAEIKYKTLREVFRLAYKSALQYGNGYIEWGWLEQIVQRIIWERVPELALMQHAMGGVFPVPTGKSSIQQSIQQQKISKPILCYRDIREIYIDPNCSSPNVQDAQFISHRGLMAIEQLLDYSQTEGFNIPDEQTLIKLAGQKFYTQGDNDKAQTEAYRGGYWQPVIDYSSDPNQKRVEVIRYWQKGRAVWLLGREHVAFNDSNQYGMLPFFSTFYTDVLGRHYSLSLADLIEGDQKFAEALLNGRIDELNLMLHSPVIKKRGMSIPNMRLRPGLVLEAENPETDFKKVEYGDITANAYVEYDALERRVQKTTGNSDTLLMGVPSSGGNSANRSATGISAQTSAQGVRISYQVENVEDQFLGALLNAFHGMDRKFLDPMQAIEISPGVMLDPLHVMNASVKFKLRAGSRMRMRHALQSGGLSLVLQTYLNPEMIQLMAQYEGRIPDLAAIDGLISDSLSMPAMSLTKQMSPEQYKAMMQAKMMDQMVKMGMQRERLEAQGQHGDEKNDTELMKAFIMRLPPDVVHKFFGMPYQAEIDAKHAPKQLGQ